MVVYVVTINNINNGERHLDSVFANEDDAFNYCWNKNREYSMRSYDYDYAAFEVKGEIRVNATL